jgi:hypothetical protein
MDFAMGPCDRVSLQRKARDWKYCVKRVGSLGSDLLEGSRESRSLHNLALLEHLAFVHEDSPPSRIISNEAGQ